MAEVADHRHDRVGRPVGAPPEVMDRLRRQAGDVRFLAADLAPQRTVAEHRGLEQDLAVLGRIVEIRADLLDDDRALALDIGRLEPRPHDQLTDDVHRALGLAPRHAHPVDGRFAIGRGVERAAHAFDRLADRPGRGIRRRALERQVLHEVGDPDLPGGLEPGAGQHVGGDGDRTRRRKPGADHAGPGRQHGPFEHRRRWYRIAGLGPRHGRGAAAMRRAQAARWAHRATSRGLSFGRPLRPGTERPAARSRCVAR